jgi:hypothetical protein
VHTTTVTILCESAMFWTPRGHGAPNQRAYIGDCVIKSTVLYGVHNPMSMAAPFRSKQRSRLTEAEVIQIFCCWHDNKSPTVVSNLYGVNEKTVRDIWSGRTWSKETRHLDPSRALAFKKARSPTGSKDTKPRVSRGLPVSTDVTPRGQNPGLDVANSANDHLRGCIVRMNTSSKTEAVSMASLCRMLSESFAEKGHECGGAVANRLISIDELLYEWERKAAG